VLDTGWLDRAFANAIAVIGAASDETLFEPIPDTRIMGEAPRIAVVSGIVDVTVLACPGKATRDVFT